MLLNDFARDKASLVRLKAGLLCQGLRISEAAARKLVQQRPYFYDKGFVHAVNMNIAGSNVCVSVAEEFCKKSPYELDIIRGALFVKGGVGHIKIKLFHDLPETGTVIDALARPHSDECISLWPSTACCFDSTGRKCKFCSIETTPVIPEDDVVLGLKALFQKESKYAVNIGGGTVKDPDTMLRYIAAIVRGFRGFSDNPVSAEFAPPSDLSLLAMLKDAGVSSAIINLEIASDDLRRQICPGKAGISYGHYYDTYRRAVAVFGRGKVSCVLLAGIQPKEDIITECAKLISAGVIPTIIPFKPMDNCEYRDKPVTDPGELLDISAEVAKLLRIAGLSPSCQEGCTRCGGCSLETNYERLNLT